MRLCGPAHACARTCVCTCGLSLSVWVSVSERRVDAYVGDKRLRALTKLRGHPVSHGPCPERCRGCGVLGVDGWLGLVAQTYSLAAAEGPGR